MTDAPLTPPMPEGLDAKLDAAFPDDNFVLVPREPTDAMKNAGMETSPMFPMPQIALQSGRTSLNTEHCADIYRAMLAAAPPLDAASATADLERRLAEAEWAKTTVEGELAEVYEERDSMHLGQVTAESRLAALTQRNEALEAETARLTYAVDAALAVVCYTDLSLPTEEEMQPFLAVFEWDDALGMFVFKDVDSALSPPSQRSSGEVGT